MQQVHEFLWVLDIESSREEHFLEIRHTGEMQDDSVKQHGAIVSAKAQVSR